MQLYQATKDSQPYYLDHYRINNQDCERPLGAKKLRFGQIPNCFRDNLGNNCETTGKRNRIGNSHMYIPRIITSLLCDEDLKAPPPVQNAFFCSFYIK